MASLKTSILRWVWVWAEICWCLDCPEKCVCDKKSLICPGWSQPQPPLVNEIESYEHLDLSFRHKKTDGNTHICVSPKTGGGPSRRAEESASGNGGEIGGHGENSPRGFGLDRGRIPAAWFGSEHFVFLRTLSMRGAALRLIDKEAFCYQLKLVCVDLSANQLQRINIFSWQRHLELSTLNLNENIQLQIPEDSPFLYSRTIKKLYLASSNVTRVNKLTFSQLSNIEVIDLSGNKLTTLDPDFFPSIKTKPIIRLEYNPWECDCGLKEALSHFRKGDPFRLEMLKNLSCVGPQNTTWDELELGECIHFADNIPNSREVTTLTENSFRSSSIPTESNSIIETATLIREESMLCNHVNTVLCILIILTLTLNVSWFARHFMLHYKRSNRDLIRSANLLRDVAESGC